MHIRIRTQPRRVATLLESWTRWVITISRQRGLNADEIRAVVLGAMDKALQEKPERGSGTEVFDRNGPAPATGVWIILAIHGLDPHEQWRHDGWRRIVQAEVERVLAVDPQ